MAATGTPLDLSDRDRARLEGAEGPALRFTMALVVRAGETLGASRLVDACFAHIDACHYTGRPHLDFARFLAEAGARDERIQRFRAWLRAALPGS